MSGTSYFYNSTISSSTCYLKELVFFFWIKLTTILLTLKLRQSLPFYNLAFINMTMNMFLKLNSIRFKISKVTKHYGFCFQLFELFFNV